MKAGAAAGALLAALAACKGKPPQSLPAPAPAPAAVEAPSGPPPEPPAPLPSLAGPPAPRPSFAAQPARLAIIPAGHELGETLFSPDGRHVAFVTSQGGNAWVHLDGTQGRPYELVRGLVFREGPVASLAFVARRGAKESVVVDGKEGTRYGAVGKVRFARDGRVVYSAKRGDAWGVVVGQRELEVEGGIDPEPVPSPDGRRVVFREQRPATGKFGLRSCTLALDGCVEGQSYDTMDPPILDRSGVRLVFLAGRDGRAAAVVADLDAPGLGERVLGWYDGVGLAGLSDGGRYVAFLATRGGRQLLVRNGQELSMPASDAPMQLEVSSAGRVAVVTTRADKAVAIVDGRQAGPGLEELGFPTFSPDGQRLAYVAGGPAMNLLVVDGAQGPVMDKVVSPHFTPVGSGLVYRARRKAERFVVQANARGQTIREHPHHEAVFDVAFSPDGTLVGYGVRDGQELWWKVERLEGTGPG